MSPGVRTNQSYLSMWRCELRGFEQDHSMRRKLRQAPHLCIAKLCEEPGSQDPNALGSALGQEATLFKDESRVSLACPKVPEALN
jgi:hypothetical protein